MSSPAPTSATSSRERTFKLVVDQAGKPRGSTAPSGDDELTALSIPGRRKFFDPNVQFVAPCDV